MTVMSQQGMYVKDSTGMLTLLVLIEIQKNQFDTNTSCSYYWGHQGHIFVWIGWMGDNLINWTFTCFSFPTNSQLLSPNPNQVVLELKPNQTVTTVVSDQIFFF